MFHQYNLLQFLVKFSTKASGRKRNFRLLCVFYSPCAFLPQQQLWCGFDGNAAAAAARPNCLQYQSVTVLGFWSVHCSNFKRKKKLIASFHCLNIRPLWRVLRRLSSDPRVSSHRRSCGRSFDFVFFWRSLKIESGFCFVSAQTGFKVQSWDGRNKFFLWKMIFEQEKELECLVCRLTGDVQWLEMRL